MKINPNAYNVGKSGLNMPVGGKKLPKKTDSAAGSLESNKDTILISHEGAMKADTEMLTRSCIAEIERPADPERLASLREAVQNGDYYVSTDKLADAIVTRWIGTV